jgi:hypothetical protein
MPKIAIPPTHPRIVSNAVPFGVALRNIELPSPMAESEANRLAAQLVAGYGKDALRLAVRHSDDLFETGDALRFSDWCRVISALENLVRAAPGESDEAP